MFDEQNAIDMMFKVLVLQRLFGLSDKDSKLYVKLISPIMPFARQLVAYYDTLSHKPCLQVRIFQL